MNATRLAATIIGTSLLLALTATAQTDATRRYDGRTMDEWRQVMKSLELTSPAAAEAVPGLIVLVRADDVPAPTRAQAAYTLGRIGEAAADAVPVLAELLHSTDERDTDGSARWAAKALGLFGAQAAEATPELTRVAMADDRSALARLAATEALGAIGGTHPDAIPTLMQLVADDFVSTAFDMQQMRAAAIDSLAMIGPSAGAAVPLLIRVTRDTSGDLRKRAAAALGAIGSSAAVATETLADLILFDELPEVRTAAATALGRIGEDGQQALSQLLSDDEVTVRRHAAAAFASIERINDAGRTALTAALQDTDVDVRLSAVEALRKATDDLAPLVTVVIDGLTETERLPRMRAYRLLVEMPSQADLVLPQLEILANDNRPFVRQAARKAIAELTVAKSPDP